jgi:hypothetical protein
VATMLSADWTRDDVLSVASREEVSTLSRCRLSLSRRDTKDTLLTNIRDKTIQQHLGTVE